MYFITKAEDLIGKTISFVHMTQFAEAITIVTDDKGVLVVEQTGDSYDKETSIYGVHQARTYVNKQEWMRKELQKAGVISEEEILEYEEEQKRLLQKKEQERLRQQEEYEKELFEKLKKKFG
jgi:fructose-bisphosphate aldolase class 1